MISTLHPPLSVTINKRQALIITELDPIFQNYLINVAKVVVFFCGNATNAREKNSDSDAAL